MHRRATQPVLDRRRVMAGGLVATAAALVACGDQQAPLDDQGRVRIRFATEGRAQAEHGGFYQALASGAYERRGLNVQIVQGGPAMDVPQLLASGAVELGMALNSFTPMSLLAEGAPVKAVAAFFQKDPQVLIAHPDPDLEGIADLAGRPFLVPEASLAGPWAWLKATYGITDDQLRPYEALPTAFLADEQAVQLGDLSTEPYLVEQEADFEPRVFLLADEGYPSYGAMVLSPDGFARDNATALRGFIAASAEGWRDYVRGDPAAADGLIRAANPEMTQDTLDQARARLSENGIVDSGDAALYGLGAMTVERWQAFFDVTSQAGLYPADLRWRSAFTDDFLPGRGRG